MLKMLRITVGLHIWECEKGHYHIGSPQDTERPSECPICVELQQISAQQGKQTRNMVIMLIPFFEAFNEFAAEVRQKGSVPEASLEGLEMSVCEVKDALTELDENLIDAEIARERLAEIESDPSTLVAGDALKAEMEAKGE